MSGRYRKRPVEVEARQFQGWKSNGREIVEWVLDNDGTAVWHPLAKAYDYLGEDALEHIKLGTLHGTARVLVGDWVVRGPSGDFWPVKPDIFAESYEASDV